MRNQESGVARTTVTGPDGHYRFPALPPGTYSVTAELAGFASQTAKDLTITIDLVLKQDFSMRIQALSSR